MAKRGVTVLGAFMADLVCRTHRRPEWGETVRGESFAMGPGGKGSNQAIAAARQGAAVHLITRLGRDAFGDMARDFYRREGLDDSLIAMDDEHTTGTASITVDDASGENAIITVPGACDAITTAHVHAAADAIGACALFVSQLELPLKVCRYAIDLAHERDVPVLLNPAPGMALPRELLGRVDYLTPNESEAAALTGQPVNSVEDAAAVARTLRDWGVGHVLITLGAQGVYVCSPEHEGRIEAVSAGDVVETTGAGDAFNGGLAAALTAGRPLAEAARYANAVAGLSVTRPGAALAMPHREEVNRLLGTAR